MKSRMLHHLMIWLLFPAFAAVAATPTIRLLCPAATSPGKEFLVTVRAIDFRTLRTYGIRVQYDTAALRCTAVIGRNYFQNYQTFYFTKIDSVFGNAGADESILGPGWNTQDGDLFSLKFVARKYGSFSFGFQTVKCYDSSTAQIVPVNTEIATILVDIRELPATIPEAPILYQNYPNPFAPIHAATVIPFAIPREGSATLAIYDLSGRRVRTLVAQEIQRGPHETAWDGRDDSGRRVAAGMYIARLVYSGTAIQKKLIVQ